MHALTRARRAYAPRARAVSAAILALTLVAAPRARQVPSLGNVLERAAAASVRFGSELQGVVAREQYLQTIRAWPGHPPTGPSDTPAPAARRLHSSLLLVHDPDTPWQLHRDVLAVDGAAVGDRQDRLARLFAAPGSTAAHRLRAITADSARYNLGHVTRTINVPTFPLLIVHPTHRGRFRFSERGRVQQDGVQVRQVTFREKGRPRVVRGERGRDVELQGVLAIDEQTGEIVHATITPRAGDLQSLLEVTFAAVAPLPVRVPVRLWEWYWVGDVPERDRYIEGDARYDDFRRYTTEVGQPIVK